MIDETFPVKEIDKILAVPNEQTNIFNLTKVEIWDALQALDYMMQEFGEEHSSMINLLQYWHDNL